MKREYAIGIDIGGTNTDAVLIDQYENIVRFHKEPTSMPIEYGFKRCIEDLLNTVSLQDTLISGVYVGTTHATNAILQAADLYKTGVIRIAGHRPELASGFLWNKELALASLVGSETIPGGFECNGKEISSFCQNAAKDAVEKLLLQGAEAISIVGVFSLINSEHEERVKEIVHAIAGKDFPVTCSHELGSVGFIARENAAIINSSLMKAVGNSFKRLQAILQGLGIQAPLWMVSNDGSIMDMNLACKMPILTIAAGQTNSFIGACKIARTQDAIVIDIGGTSTDIGVVINGYPRRSSHSAEIGSVKLQFSMPDVISLAIGGGTLIEESNHHKVLTHKSVAAKIHEQAACFGGNLVSLTDLGVFCGCLDIKGISGNNVHFDQHDVEFIKNSIADSLYHSIMTIGSNAQNVPIIVVGGAAPIIKWALDKHTELALCIPEYYTVANAYGAALAEVSYTKTQVMKIDDTHHKSLDILKASACAGATFRGADSKKIRVVNVSSVPFAYQNEPFAKVSISVSGPRSKST